MSSELSGDNAAANLIAGCATGTRSVRHLSLQQFFIRGLSLSGKVVFKLIPSNDNPSDMLTKVLSEELLMKLLSILKCVNFG